MELRSITVETLAAFAQALRAEERCTETIKQYTRSVRQFAAWLAPETVAAGSAGGWKAELLRRGLSPATVNSKLAGLNRFFRFLGWMDCTVKPLRLQRRLFRSPDRELSRAEYGRLLSAARGLGRERLGLLMEAICATGIRVSEVKYPDHGGRPPRPGGCR
ncbi:MAG: tyrosine-type recombinase/integrase [Flavonifractor plautii]